MGGNPNVLSKHVCEGQLSALTALQKDLQPPAESSFELGRESAACFACLLPRRCQPGAAVHSLGIRWPRRGAHHQSGAGAAA
eukprot:1160558-Pelagomonas_calceolata.AAC.2